MKSYLILFALLLSGCVSVKPALTFPDCPQPPKQTKPATTTECPKIACPQCPPPVTLTLPPIPPTITFKMVDDKIIEMDEAGKQLIIDYAKAQHLLKPIAPIPPK